MYFVMVLLFYPMTLLCFRCELLEFYSIVLLFYPSSLP